MTARRHRLGRRLTAVLSLLAFLTTALGVPLPALAVKPSDIPFPCQNHPCGCQTAEQCWRHCCCFTVEERWAWAREHHVVPPAYAERPRPAAGGWNEPRRRDRGKAPAACCTGSCCARPAPAKEPAKPARVPGHSPAGVNVLACHGLDALGAGGVVSLVPPVPLSGRPALPAASWLCATAAAATSDAEPPLPPPPRPVRA